MEILRLLVRALRYVAALAQEAEDVAPVSMWREGRRKLSCQQNVAKLLALARAEESNGGAKNARHVVWYGFVEEALKFIMKACPTTDAVKPQQYRSLANADLQVTYILSWAPKTSLEFI